MTEENLLEEVKTCELSPETRNDAIVPDVEAKMLTLGKEEVDGLRAQILELRKALKGAQDFVFSLQPQQQRVTESEAAVDYSSLCDSAQDWVETKLGDHIQSRTIIKERFKVLPVKTFLSYLLELGKEICRFQETDEHNIVAAIMKFPCAKIFDKEFYCDVGEGELQFLKNIQNSMSCLEPRRDISAVRYWRTETLTALINLPNFDDYRKYQSDSLVSELASILSIFIPSIERESYAFASSIYRSIIKPALTLAHKLHLSIDKFTFGWTPLSKTPPERRSHDPTSFWSFECMDMMKSGKRMKAGAFTSAKDITYMIDLAPALILETVKADSFSEPKVVQKARILVVASKDAEAPLVPPVNNKGEHPTLIYWMLERLYKTAS